jgi:hypothetical protein
MDLDQVDLNNPMGMLSHLSVSTLLASFVFGVIGFYVFRHGKKTAKYPVLFTGLALMIYPMFTSGWILDWGTGIFLCSLAYYFNET